MQIVFVPSVLSRNNKNGCHEVRSSLCKLMTFKFKKLIVVCIQRPDQDMNKIVLDPVSKRQRISDINSIPILNEMLDFFHQAGIK